MLGLEAFGDRVIKNWHETGTPLGCFGDFL